MIRHALVLLALAAGPSVRAQSSPSDRVALDVVAGQRDFDVRRAQGPFLGLRAGIRVAPRCRLRVGVEGLEAPKGGRLTLVETGAEIDFVRRDRLIVGVIGSALHVNGKASDAEEWDRIVRPWGLRAALTSRIRLGARAHVSLEAGLTRFQARDGESVADTPEPGAGGPFPPDVLGVGWDVAVGVGWTLGRQPSVHAIE